MALYWGVETASPLGVGTQVRGMIDDADARIVQEGLLDPGDLVVVVAGSPGGRAAPTGCWSTGSARPTWPPAKVEHRASAVTTGPASATLP